MGADAFQQDEYIRVACLSMVLPSEIAGAIVNFIASFIVSIVNLRAARILTPDADCFGFSHRHRPAALPRRAGRWRAKPKASVAPFGVRPSFMYFIRTMMAAAQTACGYCLRPLLQPRLAAL